MARGGYRQPSNPAPASGPGALSRRTDGGPTQPVRTPTGLPYGEAGQLTRLQQAAPLAASGGTPPPVQPGAAARPSVIPFNAPTQEPDVPVTNGAALGPGAGPEALGIPNAPSEDLRALLGYLPVFEFMASQPGASSASRNLVRQLKSMIS